MELVNRIERYRKLDSLIKEEKTGAPQELALRIGISRSHLYRMIEIMKGLRAEISYSRTRRTFYYIEPFCLSAMGI